MAGSGSWREVLGSGEKWRIDTPPIRLGILIGFHGRCFISGFKGECMAMRDDVLLFLESSWNPSALSAGCPGTFRRVQFEVRLQVAGRT
jgi:hypothetical protein